jgi:hypothetical protein
MVGIAVFRHLFHPQRSNNHRPRILHPEAYLLFSGFAVLLLLTIFWLPLLNDQAGNVLGFSSTITASEVVTKTNSERQKAGLPPVKVNAQLTEAALAKGQDMLNKQYWAHVAPDGVQPWAFFKTAKYDYSIAGENLARDFSTSEDMLRAWMNSPTHRANIVNPKYQEIGIAVIDGRLQGVETTLVVQFFGTPDAGSAVISDAALSDQVKQVAAAADRAFVLSYAEQIPQVIQINGGEAEILSSASLKVTDLSTPPLFSPLQLMKAFFLAVIFIVIVTLVYDMFIMHHYGSMRMVGKNFAHIVFFLVIAFLVVYLKSGVIT